MWKARGVSVLGMWSVVAVELREKDTHAVQSAAFVYVGQVCGRMVCAMMHT